MKEHFINTVGQLSEAVFELESFVEYPERETKRLRWWFRGQRKDTWDLLPSGKRGYDEERERFLTNDFYARAATRHPKCPARDDYAAWLQLMQHFGLPTRLLDWTSSPLIAAYFATEHCLEQPSAEAYDSCIWALAPGLFNIDRGFAPYVYPLDAGRLEAVIRPAFKGNDTTDTIVAAMAVENDPRIQVQQGSFTVHSSRTPINHLKGCEKWLVKLIIPGEFAQLIVLDIGRLGFRRGDLFPDLDNLARELKSLIKPESAQQQY